MLKLRKRNKTWHYDIHIDGKRYKGSTHSDNKDLAKEYAQKKYNDLYSSQTGIKKPKTTIQEFIKLYLEHKSQSNCKEWLYTMSKHLGRFGTFAKEKNIDYLNDIDILTLESYKTYISPDVKKVSVKNNIGVIAAMLAYAVKIDYLDKNPANKLQPIRGITHNKKRFLNKNEIETLLNACKDKYFADLIKVGIYTGMRRGELVHLEHSDIDIDKKLIYVRNKEDLGFRTKSRKERIVPVHQDILPCLTNGNGNSFCFTLKNKKINKRDLTEDFRDMTKRIGLNDVSLHTLRHTFISHCLMAGISIWEVAQWAGHSTAHMTEQYGHLCPERREIDKLFALT